MLFLKPLPPSSQELGAGVEAEARSTNLRNLPRLVFPLHADVDRVKSEVRGKSVPDIFKFFRVMITLFPQTYY